MEEKNLHDHKNERWIILILAFMQFAHILDFVIMMPLGPYFMREFGITSSQFGILVSAYTFSAGFFGMLGVLFLDRFDRKVAAIFVFSGFTIGTFSCAFAPNYYILLAARSIAGGFGGIIGAILGFTLHRLLRSIDDYETEVLLTIAFVMGGYWMCNFIHISGPLAMVIMGLLVGNYKKSKAMSDVTQEYIGKFWELFDVILNALLFITIAFIIIVIDINVTYLIISLITIFIVLLSRIIVVFLPKLLLPRIVQITNSEAKIIIWGGLRGGLSIALVLSLPVSPQRDLLILITYVIVVVSILVQGMTIERLVRKLK